MSAAGPSAPLVGIDLGGTAIKAGAISAAGEPIRRLELPAEVERGAEHVVRRIAELARELGCAGGLGLGVPGLLDRRLGLVTASPNLGPIAGFPLRDALARELGLAPSRVLLENDANAAALGEHWIGGARGESDLLFVTLGTGVGGGLVLGGRLYAGTGGLAGEIGHVIVEPEGLPCGCGRRGCVETLASATAARRRARERGLLAELAELSAAARSGDGAARSLFRAVGRDLGHALALCVTLLDLRCFVVGGGFGAAIDQLEEGILEGILERSFGREREDLRILRATLGPDAGWIGAAALLRDRSRD